MNRITVIGRIVRDIRLKDVGDGRLVMNNSIAIPRTFKKPGEQDADFMNIVAWGKRAELLENYCNKGDLVGLDGRVQSRNYQNDEDQTVFVVELVVENVTFIQSRRVKTSQTNANGQQAIQTANGEQVITTNETTTK